MEENRESLLKRGQFMSGLKNVAKTIKNKRISSQGIENFKSDQFCKGDDMKSLLQPSCDDSKTIDLHDVYSNDFLKCDEVLPASDNDDIDEYGGNKNLTTDLFENSDNSKDKDYNPEWDEYLDDSDAEKKIIVKNIYIQKQRPNQEDYYVQHCEYGTCDIEVFSTCGVCFSLLCWDHFNNDKTFNDCQNHSKGLPTQQRKPSKSCAEIKKYIKTNIRKIALNEKLPFPIRKSNQKRSKIENDENSKQPSTKKKSKRITQQCEYIGCNQDGQSSCARCLCLLCLNHFLEPDYDSCAKHICSIEQEIPQTAQYTSSTTYDNGKNTIVLVSVQNQHCENIDCIKPVFTTCMTCRCLLCFEHYMTNESCDKHKPYTTDLTGQGPLLTKYGTLRKRKLHEEKLIYRKEKVIQKRENKYAIKEPCLNTCKKQCTSNFSDDCREQYHNMYRALNWEAQGVFIKGLIEQKPVERRKLGAQIKKNVSNVYYMIADDGNKKEVCKTFFLSTLGYDPKNDRRVLSVLKKPVDSLKDLRGTNEKRNKIDREVIKNHVLKYNPTISHYRRKHAPNRLYLPSDISITSMFKDFCKNYPEIKISSETYRKVIKDDLNISFAHLGHEECEQCAIFKHHKNDNADNHSEGCEICIEYEQHRAKYTICRQKYQLDVKRASDSTNEETIFYSVDLQKVVMLPRMEQYKMAIFCPRIIAYNETFVPLGPTTKKDMPFAVVWPETVSGRNKEDIISTFRAFFLHKRDAKNIVLWLDNCAAQNKNWALLCFLVDIVNSDLISCESISLKYFEPGHSFMSADSFHHQVELSLKRKEKVYDFNDFIDAVRESNSGKNKVKEMKVDDFYIYKDCSSQVKLRKLEPRCYLKDIMAVKVQRGQFDVMYKTGHQEPEQRLDFLMVKIKKKLKFPLTKQKSSPRGITDDRKAAIIEKLLPLMPANRKSFWYNLPISESPSNINDDEDMDM